MNRYDAMKASTTSQDIDNQSWPDILSSDYNQFTFSYPSTKYPADDTLLTSPFLVSYLLYGQSGYASNDDIVMNVNNVPHLSLLAPDTVLSFPDTRDITAFVKKQQGL